MRTLCWCRKIHLAKRGIHWAGKSNYNKRICEGDSKAENCKVPGTTGMSPDVFKCLEGKNQKRIFWYVIDFWEGKVDYWEWHVGLGMLVFNKGNLSNPNKWCGIGLINVCSKIFSCILNKCCYYLLTKMGPPHWTTCSIYAANTTCQYLLPSDKRRDAPWMLHALIDFDSHHYRNTRNRCNSTNAMREVSSFTYLYIYL